MRPSDRASELSRGPCRSSQDVVNRSVLFKASFHSSYLGVAPAKLWTRWRRVHSSLYSVCALFGLLWENAFRPGERGQLRKDYPATVPSNYNPQTRNARSVQVSLLRNRCSGVICILRTWLRKEQRYLVSPFKSYCFFFIFSLMTLWPVFMPPVFFTHCVVFEFSFYFKFKTKIVPCQKLAFEVEDSSHDFLDTKKPCIGLLSRWKRKRAINNTSVKNASWNRKIEGIRNYSDKWISVSMSLCSNVHLRLDKIE